MFSTRRRLRAERFRSADWFGTCTSRSSWRTCCERLRPTRSVWRSATRFTSATTSQPQAMTSASPPRLLERDTMTETRFQIVVHMGMSLQHEVFIFATSREDAEATFRLMIESLGGSLDDARLEIDED